MEAKAEARYIRISPQKARLVVDLIRGQQAGQAITTLRTTNKRIAPTVEKVLKSAIANAENNKGAKPELLRVKEAVAGTATTMKRFVPKARGSAGPILKRSCHIKIVLSDS